MCDTDVEKENCTCSPIKGPNQVFKMVLFALRRMSLNGGGTMCQVRSYITSHQIVHITDKELTTCIKLALCKGVSMGFLRRSVTDGKYYIAAYSTGRCKRKYPMCLQHVPPKCPPIGIGKGKRQPMIAKARKCATHPGNIKDHPRRKIHGVVKNTCKNRHQQRQTDVSDDDDDDDDDEGFCESMNVDEDTSDGNDEMEIIETESRATCKSRGDHIGKSKKQCNGKNASEKTFMLEFDQTSKKNCGNKGFGDGSHCKRLPETEASISTGNGSWSSSSGTTSGYLNCKFSNGKNGTKKSTTTEDSSSSSCSQSTNSGQSSRFLSGTEKTSTIGDSNSSTFSQSMKSQSCKSLSAKTATSKSCSTEDSSSSSCTQSSNGKKSCEILIVDARTKKSNTTEDSSSSSSSQSSNGSLNSTLTTAKSGTEKSSATENSSSSASSEMTNSDKEENDVTNNSKQHHIPVVICSRCAKPKPVPPKKVKKKNDGGSKTGCKLQ